MTMLPSGAPSWRGYSLLNVIRKLGLSANLKLCLDAGDINSWPGTGQSFLDTSGNGYDFLLGSTSGSDTSDPTFAGTAGQLSGGEYASFDGGDYFTYDSANEAWMNALHKDGAQFTIAAWLYRNGGSATGWLGTDGNSTAATGVEFMTFGGAAMLRVTNGSGSYALNKSALTVNDTAWNFVSVSVDEGAASGFFNVNGVVTTIDSTYSSPSSGDATRTMQIGALGNASTPPANGARLAAMAVWQGAALSQGQVAAIRLATRGRFGV